MKPVKFKHQNTVFAEGQSEYQPLPSLKIERDEGDVITCWKLSLYERLQVLLFGKVWLSLLSFNKPLTPIYMSVNRKDMFIHSSETVPWYKKL